MHINDINAFALKTGLNERFAGRNARVMVVLPKDGQRHYISRQGGTTTNKAEAFVYHYDRDSVADQCEQVVQLMGVTPEVEEYIREYPANLA